MGDDVQKVQVRRALAEGGARPGEPPHGTKQGGHYSEMKKR